MSYDPKNPHNDPYTAMPAFENQPTTGYPDSGPPHQGYPDSAPPHQQGGYSAPYVAGYPQQPVYNQAGFAPPPMYAAPDNGVGTAALVLGIIGLVGCMPCAIPAVICGHMGVKKADRGEADNRGQAQAGMIMGYIGGGLWLLVILLYVFIFIVAIGAASTSPSTY